MCIKRRIKSISIQRWQFIVAEVGTEYRIHVLINIVDLLHVKITSACCGVNCDMIAETNAIVWCVAFGKEATKSRLSHELSASVDIPVVQCIRIQLWQFRVAEVSTEYRIRVQIDARYSYNRAAGHRTNHRRHAAYRWSQLIVTDRDFCKQA